MKSVKIKMLVMIIGVLIMCGWETNQTRAKETKLYVTESLEVDCDSMEPLYNVDDKVVAYYFDGDNGYAIIGLDGTLIEFSEESKIDKFDNTDCEKSYYAGTGEYYIESKKDNEIENVYTGKEINKETVQNIEIDPYQYNNSGKKKAELDVSKNKKSVTITYPDGGKDPKGKTTYTDTFFKTLTFKSKANLPYSTRYFSYNVNGTCGSTASAIMMYYYYDHIGSSYITNNSYIGKTEAKQKAFVNHFKSLLGDNGNGTGYKKVKDGINKYLGEIGKSKNCDYITSANILENVSSRIMKCIDNKRPCIVGLDGEPTYGDHWVVGVGYAKYYGINGRSRRDVYFIKVNNGWYTTSSKSIVYVNYDYVDGVIFLK